MSAQFDLFGAPPTSPKVRRPPTPPAGQDRLLFAIYPEPEAVEAILRQGAALRAEHRLVGRPRPPQILHMTLRHVGDFVGPPPEVVETLLGALADFTAPAFEITLDQTMRFAGSRAFVLLAGATRNAGLIDFQQALCERLDAAGAGWRVGGAAFTPHVTLSYEDVAVAQPIDPIRWTVRDFVLTHSLIGQTRHDTMARFPLG